ncbi:MAG: hypothetical protein P8X95_27875 [Anaerolineales bacterium]
MSVALDLEALRGRVPEAEWLDEAGQQARLSRDVSAFGLIRKMDLPCCSTSAPAT